MKRLLLIAITSLALAADPKTASIRGQVRSDEGRPVPNAVLLYNQTAPFVPGTPMVQSRINLPNDGTFTISNLPAGSYALCIQVAAGGYLDPCHWSDPPTVALAAAQAVTGVAVTAKRGHKLQIHVDDPQGHMGNEGKVPGVHLLIGAWTPRHLFQPARVSNSSARSRDYSVTVPFDAPVNITATSASFAVNDGRGQPVQVNRPTTVTIPSNGAAPAVSFTVTGYSAPHK